MGIARSPSTPTPTATRATSSWPTRPCTSAPAPPRESYLVADKIIAACKQTGAEAVHPGYGFLSRERGLRAPRRGRGHRLHRPQALLDRRDGRQDRVEEAGQRGQGQHHPGLERRDRHGRAGGRDRQRHRLPGDDQGLAPAAAARACAWRFNDKEAFDGFTSCRNEARNSFGDDRVFIEKFVEEPRHIEIQVLGDAHGNVVYLSERECSIQRRHQKVIEEAPSPFISDATRKAMGEQAVALAKAVNYQSAGTVEFVVGKDQSFYFLEMNTRLQVEHPVTECITGLDLVELMIRVAAGEKLPFTQADVQAQRLGDRVPHQRRGSVPQLPAVDRPAGALPAAEGDDVGRGHRCTCGGVRVDTGVYEGGEIPMYYDSMIAKLIVHGRDRSEAIAQDARGAQRLRDPRHHAATSRSRRRCWRIRSSSPATSTPASSPSTTARASAPRTCRTTIRDFLVALAAFVHRRDARSAPPASAASCRATACKVGRAVRRGRARRRAASTRTTPCRSTISQRQTGSSVGAVGGAQLRDLQQLGSSATSASTAPATASRSPRRSSAARQEPAGACASSHNGTQIEALVLLAARAPSCRADAATRRRPT